MEQPLVSVVIPTYNRAHCLAATVRSALQQTYRRVEIVIVDDGSSDDTAALVSREWSTESRLRYIPQDNQGVSAARNRGFAESRGDFVALLDSDDLWEPWKLELQLACMRTYPEVGMCWTDMIAVGPDGVVASQAYLRTMYSAWSQFTVEELFAVSRPVAELNGVPAGPFAGRFAHVGDLYSPMIVGNLVHTSTVLIRRDRLEKTGGFDESLRPTGEDHEFHLRTCKHGPVAFIDLPTITYRIGMPDALSRHAICFARSFLTTVTRAITEDRARITLSQSRIDAVLAEANAWVGQVLLEQGDAAAARRYFFASLRHDPRRRATLKLTALAVTPSWLRGGLRECYHVGKRAMGWVRA